ncbi:MAG: penicillin-binding transpeptidase domain-containing protein [Solirubrobacteraceae bacterium]
MVGLSAVAGAALVAGVVVGATSSSSSPEEELARRYADAWERNDYAAMYSLISPSDRRSVSRSAFEDAYRDAAVTATLIGVTVGDPPRSEAGDVVLPVTARTRIFRPIRARVPLTFTGEGEKARINWAPQLAFPGLAAGERLSRRARLAPRAAILARDGTPLARGPDRASSLGGLDSSIVGELGTPPPAQRTALQALGYPKDALVGITGLERVFERRVAGTPGGTLRAGRRVLARARPERGQPARATIDPTLQTASVNALGGQLGGIAVLDPRNGEILSLAGIALDGLQPPGSTMKVITVTAALEERLVTFRSRFPVVTSANVGGQTISNASGEACGGDLREVFAESCNSVFAPLGVKLGARKLVRAARRFGFDEPTGIPGAAVNTIPPAREMPLDAEVGSSAIGQGEVLTTALGLASMVQAIANDGLRLRPVLVKGQRAKAVRATSRRIAKKVSDLMLGVVAFGTGTEAAIPGVKVAGKTGTAELGGDLDEDAWFVAFAPARRPELAIGVLVVQAGFGGDVAAPIAKQVLEVGLKR